MLRKIPALPNRVLRFHCGGWDAASVSHHSASGRTTGREVFKDENAKDRRSGGDCRMGHLGLRPVASDADRSQRRAPARLRAAAGGVPSRARGLHPCRGALGSSADGGRAGGGRGDSPGRRARRSALLADQRAGRVDARAGRSGAFRRGGPQRDQRLALRRVPAGQGRCHVCHRHHLAQFPPPHPRHPHAQRRRAGRGGRGLGERDLARGRHELRDRLRPGGLRLGRTSADGDHPVGRRAMAVSGPGNQRRRHAGTF